MCVRNSGNGILYRLSTWYMGHVVVTLCSIAWWSVLFGVHYTQEPSVLLSGNGQRGARLISVIAGERVAIEVRVTGNRRDAQQWPTVPGLKSEYIVGRRRTNEVAVINGVQQSTSSFMYDVIFPYPGSVVLGPVGIVDGGKEYYSDRLECVVRADDGGARPLASLDRDGRFSAFFAWEISPQHEQEWYYVGQKIPIQLVLYSSDPSLTIEALSKQEVEGGRLQLAQDPVWDTAYHTGRLYHRCVWSGHCVAKAAGEFWLPAVVVAFTRADAYAQGSQSPWQIMQRMMQGFAGEQRRAPPRRLSIRDLPPIDARYAGMPFIGVGSVDAIEWKLSSPHVEVGSALVAVRSIRGSLCASAEHLPAPLVNERLQLYFSPSTVQSVGESDLREEQWIVHAIKEGEVILEKQDFLWFNPVLGCYGTTQSAAQTIVCMPAASSQSTDGIQDTQPHDGPEEHSADSVAVLISDGTADVEELPDSRLFGFWLLLPLLILGIYRVVRWVYLIVGRICSIYTARRTMCKHMATLSSRDLSQIRGWIDEYMRSASGMEVAIALLPGVIARLFDRAGISAAEQERWYRFWQRIECAAFDRSANAEQRRAEQRLDDRELLDEVRYWVDHLLRCSWRLLCR